LGEATIFVWEIFDRSNASKLSKDIEKLFRKLESFYITKKGIRILPEANKLLRNIIALQMETKF